MSAKAPLERLTFSPGEFATLFGRSQTWGYRQIYLGNVKAITEYGRILIPAAEVEKMLASASRYEGSKKEPPRTKADLQAMQPALESAWRTLVARARVAGAKAKKRVPSLPRSAVNRPDARKAAIDRLTGRKDDSGRDP